jgi:LysM repeat protein
MSKQIITESELVNLAKGLTAYLGEVEVGPNMGQVNKGGYDPTDPTNPANAANPPAATPPAASVGGLDAQQMAQNTLQPGMNAGVPNPWTGKDPAKAAAWAKLSPMVQKKIGMADPTDNIIVGRMAKGEFGGLFGGGATDANPDGTAKAATIPVKANAAADQATVADLAQLKTLIAQLAGGQVKESTSYFLEKLRLLEADAIDPAKAAIIKQIQDIMARINSNNENPTPEIMAALGDAQKAIDTASASPAPAPTATTPTATTPTATKAAYKGSPGAQAIQKLNPSVVDVNKIVPGQTLKMPNGKDYVVQKGDTLDGIAAKQGSATPPAATPPTATPPTATKPATPPVATKPATPPAQPTKPPIPYEKVPSPDLQNIVKQSLNNPANATNPVVMDPKDPKFDFKKASAAATNPVKETTGYSDEQVLARIVDLARR